VNFVNIPQELKNNAPFCLWKLEKRSGRPTKVPYNSKTGALARTNDPSTFADFGTAMTAYAMGGWDGIGYRVSEGIGAIDIDHCIREDGSLNDVAASILSFFPDIYFEKSPSGTGLRGFFRLSPDFAYDKTVYYINNRKHGLEVYLPGMTNRFVTVTGDVFKPGSVTRNDDALQNCLNTFMRHSSRAVGKAIEPCSYLTDEKPGEHDKDILFKREEILHIPGLGFNGLVGFSPIAMMKNSLGTTLAVEKYGSAFFKNGAQPAGVLEHPGVLKDPQKIRDRDDIGTGVYLFVNRCCGNHGLINLLQQSMILENLEVAVHNRLYHKRQIQ